MFFFAHLIIPPPVPMFAISPIIRLFRTTGEIRWVRNFVVTVVQYYQTNSLA